MKFNHRIIILVLFIITIPSFSYSQAKKEPIFPVNDIYFKDWGWKAAIGGNYTIPLSGKTSITYGEGSDTISDFLFSPVGKVGMMIEGGAFYLLDNPIVSYLDADIRVNWFNGKENFAETRIEGGSGDTILSQEGYRSFSQFNVSLRLNANNTIQVSEYGFIQNTLGLNFDYLFYESQEINPPVFPLQDPSDEFQMQLHYKLAYGLRLDLMHYMIIGVDVPVLTLFPWDDGKQTIAMFESRYWPLTLSVQILFLQKSNRPDCKKPPPLNMNKKRKKAKMF